MTFGPGGGSELIDQVLRTPANAELAWRVSAEVAEICRTFPLGPEVEYAVGHV